MQFQISSRSENNWRDTWLIKVRVFRKVLSIQFCLIRSEDNLSRSLNRGGKADLLLLRTLLAICQKYQKPKVSKAKSLGNDELFCFISIYKFGSFKNPFAMITSLTELYFRFRRFILLVQMKKMTSINCSSSTSSLKPWRWVKLDLILMMRIYIKSNLNPFTKFTSRSSSTEFKDIPTWNISQMITKTVPINTRKVMSYSMK